MLAIPGGNRFKIGKCAGTSGKEGDEMEGGRVVSSCEEGECSEPVSSFPSTSANFLFMTLKSPSVLQFGHAN
jgi:hypothetical protein